MSPKCRQCSKHWCTVTCCASHMVIIRDPCCSMLHCWYLQKWLQSPSNDAVMELKTFKPVVTYTCTHHTAWNTM